MNWVSNYKEGHEGDFVRSPLNFLFFWQNVTLHGFIYPIRSVSRTVKDLRFYSIRIIKSKPVTFSQKLTKDTRFLGQIQRTYYSQCRRKHASRGCVGSSCSQSFMGWKIGAQVDAVFVVGLHHSWGTSSLENSNLLYHGLQANLTFAPEVKYFYLPRLFATQVYLKR